MCDVAVRVSRKQFEALHELVALLWTHNQTRQWRGLSAAGIPSPVYRLRPSRVAYVCLAFEFGTGVSLYYTRKDNGQ